jgi:predicted  nucleic acid-binding Zn-ribbon protein
MPDIINVNENVRREEAMQQIASIIRMRALARNTQALARRREALLDEKDELTLRLQTLNTELLAVNSSIINAQAGISIIRRRIQTASERVTLGTRQATQEQIQGNAGDSHRSARNTHDSYRNANPTDSAGILSYYTRYHDQSSLIHATSQERVRPLVAESNSVLHTMRAAQESLNDLTRRRTTLMQEIAELEARRIILNRESDQLNRAHGKKRRYKKGTKAKRGGAWTLKYKRSINCMRPKGFSQKQYCKYGRKSKTSKKI